MKLLAVIAAFVLLGFSPANASSFTYDLSLASPYSGISGLVTGTITTNCNTCTLSAYNITAYSITGNDFTHSPATISSADPTAVLSLQDGSDLVATPTGIFFNFVDKTSQQALLMNSGVGSNVVVFDVINNALCEGGTIGGCWKFDGGPDNIYIGVGGFFNTGLFDLTAIAFAAPVSTTPLPPALALYATGLGALSIFGWFRKRWQKAKVPAT